MTDKPENVSDPSDIALTYECKKVMEAGIWLLRNGYGRLMLLPYIGGAGWWRLELHVEGKTELNWFRYSSADGSDYLSNHNELKLRRNVSAERLAQAILSSAPEYLLELCAGPTDAETTRWLLNLEKSLKLGLLPVAIEESKTDDSVWHTVGLLGQATHHIEPQPRYIAPGNIHRRSC